LKITDETQSLLRADEFKKTSGRAAQQIHFLFIGEAKALTCEAASGANGVQAFTKPDVMRCSI
jgi:hypothetical protein